MNIPKELLDRSLLGSGGTDAILEKGGLLSPHGRWDQAKDLADLFYHQPEGWLILDRSLKVLGATPSAEGLFRIEIGRFPGRSFMAFFDETHREALGKELLELRGDAAYCGHLKLVAADQSPLELKIRGYRLHSGHLALSLSKLKAGSKAAYPDTNHFQALQLLISGSSLKEVLNGLVLDIESSNAALLCSILLMDPEGQHLLLGAAPSLPDFYNEAVHGISIGEGQGSCGTAAARGERVIVENIQQHPYWLAYRDLASKAGLAACWSQPIVSSKGSILGTFAIYHRTPTPPLEEDLEAIKTFAAIAAIAIEKDQDLGLLRRSEERYALAMEALSCGIRDWDLVSQSVRWNTAFYVLFGYAKGDFTDAPWAFTRAVHPEDVEALEGSLKAAIEGQDLEWHQTYRFLRQSGEWAVVEEKALIRRDDQGRAQRLIGALDDVTGEHQLQMAFQMSDFAMKTFSDAIYWLHKDGRFFYVNDAAVKATGYSRDELMTLSLSVIDPSITPQIFEDLWATLRKRGSIARESITQMKDGRVFPVEVVANYMRFEGEEFAVGVVRDISDRKRVESELARYREELEKTNRLDYLTQVANRRALEERLEDEWRRAVREPAGLSLLMIDIDHFKDFNDQFGHLEGDAMLLKLAQALKAGVGRAADFVARFGGEEFVVLLPKTKSDQAMHVAESLRSKVEALLGPITISIGVSSTRAKDQDLPPEVFSLARVKSEVRELIASADDALYKAKANGRNCIMRGSLRDHPCADQEQSLPGTVA